MFYRYEARLITSKTNKPEWKGIFSIMTKNELNKWWCLPVPQWYKKHPNSKTKAWFTEYGYNKYHEKMENVIQHIIIEENRPYDIRLLKQESIPNIVMKGKTQCLQQIWTG